MGGAEVSHKTPNATSGGPVCDTRPEYVAGLDVARGAAFVDYTTPLGLLPSRQGRVSG